VRACVALVHHNSIYELSIKADCETLARHSRTRIVWPNGSVIIPLTAVAGARVLKEFSINSNYHISARTHWAVQAPRNRPAEHFFLFCKLAFSTQSHCQHQFNATSPDVQSCKTHYFAFYMSYCDACLVFISIHSTETEEKSSWSQIEVSVFLVY
jgi:hypothetical protein